MLSRFNPSLRMCRYQRTSFWQGYGNFVIHSASTFGIASFHWKYPCVQYLMIMFWRCAVSSAWKKTLQKGQLGRVSLTSSRISIWHFSATDLRITGIKLIYCFEGQIISLSAGIFTQRNATPVDSKYCSCWWILYYYLLIFNTRRNFSYISFNLKKLRHILLIFLQINIKARWYRILAC